MGEEVLEIQLLNLHHAANLYKSYTPILQAHQRYKAEGRIKFSIKVSCTQKCRDIELVP